MSMPGYGAGAGAGASGTAGGSAGAGAGASGIAGGSAGAGAGATKTGSTPAMFTGAASSFKAGGAMVVLGGLAVLVL
jgi:hypothetical protein